MAIQALAQKVDELAATLAGFAEKFTTKELTFVRAEGDYLTVRKLFCLDDVCVTRNQFAAMLAAANQAASPSGPSGQGSGNNSTTSSSTPPVITIAGNNPAHITVGTMYQDLGATAKDSEGHDLGVKTFLNGVLVNEIVLDTSTTTTDTIDYVATDTNGLSSTSTRQVIIEAVSPI